MYRLAGKVIFTAFAGTSLWRLIEDIEAKPER